MPVHRATPTQLGDLELAVLNHLWRVGESDVGGVHRAVGARRGITPNTVGSAVERLYKKGLLLREKVSHAYRYRPKLRREDFAARRMLEAAGGAARVAEAGLLSAFVELVLEEDESTLERLEALIAQKRSERIDA